MSGTILIGPDLVGISVDPVTGGYRLAAADGGVFAFGAPFGGSAVGLRLNAPIVGIATDPGTGGYWLAAADGGVFSYGVPFYGRVVGAPDVPVTARSPLIRRAIGWRVQR